jgi:hypothetical protein
MDEIHFEDYEMKKIMEETGMKRLELLGIIAVMNRFHVPKMSRRRQYDEDERMGRNVY